MTIPYHSALAKGKLETADPLFGSFKDRGNVVFAWDVNVGAPPHNIPGDYWTCDLLYVEPSWPAGLAAFDQRAGIVSPAFDTYAERLGAILTTLNKPAVFFVSARALRFMPIPDMTYDADLNGNLTTVAFWNGAFGVGDTNRDLIRDLATRYNRVGDFCCGYGTTGRLFAEASKTFVMSDYNAVCCGYVAREMPGWGL